MRILLLRQPFRWMTLPCRLVMSWRLLERLRKIATNMYQAHKQAVEDGMFHWSEAGYLKYAMGYD
jgi:hypothetical protein